MNYYKKPAVKWPLPVPLKYPVLIKYKEALLLLKNGYLLYNKSNNKDDTACPQ
jgi:hypothetical protein